MRYIQQVTSPIKGGVNARLGKRTVLVGPNGAGKTAVIQAIELATIGQVTDIEGRDKASRSAALARLFPPEGPFESSVKWSDGETHAWVMEERKGGFKTPQQPDNPFEVRFPIRELKAVLSSADESVRAWMEGQIFTQVSESDLIRAVGAVHEKAVRKLVAKEGSTDFLTLAKAGKSRARSLRTEATGKAKTVEEMMTGTRSPLLDFEREDLQKKLDDLVADGGSSSFDIELSRKRAAELREAAERTREKIEGLESALKGAKGLKTSQRLAKVLSLMELHHEISPDGDVCLLCGDKDVRATIEQRKAAIEARLAAFEKETKLQAALDHAREDLAILNQSLDQEEKKLAEAEGKVDHSAEIEKIRKQLAQDEIARTSWENANRTRQKVASMRTMAQEYADAAEQLDTVGRRLINSRRDAFTQRISKFLAFGDQFDVDLDTSRVGLSRRGQLHTALSGVEESRVLLALAADAGQQDAILVPPDRAWDKNTLTETMRSLANVDTQIIIMSTVRPDPIAGWDILDIR